MDKLHVFFYKTGALIRRTFDLLSQTKGGRGFLIFLGLSIIFRWFYYIHQYSVNVLFYDMWTFYEAFFKGKDSFFELFTRQHGPHRQGIGFVLTKYIDQISGWNTRWICFAIGIFVFASSMIYLKIKKNLFGSLHYFDVIVLFIILTPVQYELFANTPNLSHGAMPAFLLSLYCMAWFIKSKLLRYGSIVVINFLLIYSGFGFFMGLITPIILGIDLWRYRAKRSLKVLVAVALLLSVLSFGTFFINYEFNATANESFKFPHDKPLEYLDYMIVMMSTALNGKFASGLIAIILCICVGIIHLRCMFKASIESKTYLLSKIILILLLFSFVFMINTAIGRVSIGIMGAKATRYTIYLLPAVLAIYFHICNLKWATYKLLAPLGLAFLLIRTTFIGSEIVMMKGFRDSKKTWKQVYLETRDMDKAAENTLYNIHPHPEENQIKEKLEYLEERNLNLFLDAAD